MGILSVVQDICQDHDIDRVIGIGNPAATVLLDRNNLTLELVEFQARDPDTSRTIRRFQDCACQLTTPATDIEHSVSSDQVRRYELGEHTHSGIIDGLVQVPHERCDHGPNRC